MDGMQRCPGDGSELGTGGVLLGYVDEIVNIKNCRSNPARVPGDLWVL